MEIYCPGCDCSFTFEGQPPRFCQNCGNALSLDVAPAARADSLTTNDADATIAPTTKVVRPAEPTGIGEMVGAYQLVRWLGSGGMGNVWEAIETKTGRRVALKRLAKNMVSDETYVKRFVREAQIAAQISHSKVTFIYGAGNHEGQPYIAMELMPGKTLADKVEEEGPLVYPIAVDGIIDVVDGLIGAHRLGLIHRDVKPSNCFLATDDSVKIGDFGLSKSLSNTEISLTQTGTFMGTPSYAAPEQIRGGELDGRTDIYAIGATLFFLLTGQTPFRGDAMSVTAQIISDQAPHCSSVNKIIPKDLGGVIAKCLEKDPAKRFQDLEQLKIALTPFATQREALADVGRRLAAYMIDQTMIQIVFTIGLICAGIFLQVRQGQSAEEAAQAFQASGKSIVFWGNIVCWSFTLLYYAICEGHFGRGLGKRLMGLKVVNKEGQRAGFGRALLRTCVIPGALGIPFLFAIWHSFYGTMPTTVDENMVQLLRGTALSYLPSLIFVSTMRTSNRLLGIHGMISGTRVIRLISGEQKTNIPVVQPLPNKIDLVQFGPYGTSAVMGESQFGTVYLGHDKQLNRDVWIVVRQDECEPSSKRINLARIARQRWLEGGCTSEGIRWDAFEAIHGVPIQTFVGIQNQADWKQYGQVMIDIVDELKESLLDGTLPPSLSLPQVWLDKDGHARLLDKQLVISVGPGDSQSELLEPGEATQEIEKAVGLVQELADLLIRTQLLPASVQDFLIELGNRPKTISTLDWAGEQLQILSKNIGSLTWDSRLGMLSATMGIEFIVYGLTAGLWFLFCDFVVPVPNNYRFILGAGFGLLLPVLISAWMGGGPVFRLMKIQVCNSRGRKASEIIVGVRAAITWLPTIIMVGVFVLMMIVAEGQTTHVDPEPGSLAAEMHDRPMMVLVAVIGFVVSGIALAIGMLFAILNPKRGLVDLLLRTRLMPY